MGGHFDSYGRDGGSWGWLFFLSHESLLCYADRGEILLQLLGRLNARICLLEEIHSGNFCIDVVKVVWVTVLASEPRFLWTCREYLYVSPFHKKVSESGISNSKHAAEKAICMLLFEPLAEL